MAFMDQNRKKERLPQIKKVLKEYGVKGTVAVRHHSTLVVNIKSGKLDFGDHPNGVQVNPYWYGRHFEESPLVVEFLDKLMSAMKGEDYFNKDDSMTDYFHRSHYNDINIGGWKTPYELTE